jgi:hypothetical protein
MSEPMKPVIILPPDVMSAEDIQELRTNGICVVVAKDPDAVRFIDPPPIGHTAQERAAIKLCRLLLIDNGDWHVDKKDIWERFCHYVTEGTALGQLPPKPVPTVPAPSGAASTAQPRRRGRPPRKAAD